MASERIKDRKVKITPTELLKAFDSAIGTMRQLVSKVKNIPVVGKRAADALEQVLWVRSRAAEGIAKVDLTINALFEKIILLVEGQAALSKKAIVNLNNVHYRGALPEATAVTLMRKPNPCPTWLNDDMDIRWPSADLEDNQQLVADAVRKGHPPLTDTNIQSFHKFIKDEIKGPAKLIRILSPNSRAMSDCWISEKVFNDLQNSPDPRAAWRKFLAVWPDWNVNGQFVVYDVKPGETLKVWRGPASSQTKEGLAGRHLEGGYEQIIFNTGKKDPRNDTIRYYKKNTTGKNITEEWISQKDFDNLTGSEKALHVGIRQKINHPNISGPFETGWGYTDFNGSGLMDKVGLPALPGQLTSLNR